MSFIFYKNWYKGISVSFIIIIISEDIKRKKKIIIKRIKGLKVKQKEIYTVLNIKNNNSLYCFKVILKP